MPGPQRRESAPNQAGDEAPDMSIFGGVPVASAYTHNGPHTTVEQTGRGTHTNTPPAAQNIHAASALRAFEEHMDIPEDSRAGSLTDPQAPARHALQPDLDRETHTVSSSLSPLPGALHTSEERMEDLEDNGAGSSTDPPASARRNLLPDLDREAHTGSSPLSPLHEPTEHERVLSVCQLFLRVLYNDRAERQQFRTNRDRAIPIAKELRDPANTNSLTRHTARACRQHDQTHATTFEALLHKALGAIFSARPIKASTQAAREEPRELADPTPPRSEPQNLSSPNQDRGPTHIIHYRVGPQLADDGQEAAAHRQEGWAGGRQVGLRWSWTGNRWLPRRASTSPSRHRSRSPMPSGQDTTLDPPTAPQTEEDTLLPPPAEGSTDPPQVRLRWHWTGASCWVPEHDSESSSFSTPTTPPDLQVPEALRLSTGAASQNPEGTQSATSRNRSHLPTPELSPYAACRRAGMGSHHIARARPSPRNGTEDMSSSRSSSLGS